MIVPAPIAEDASSEADIMTSASENRLDLAASRLLRGLLLGIFSGPLLLWIYAWCMVDTTQPDWITNKLHMMFQMPDPGVVTVLALSGLACALLLMGSSGITLLRRGGPFRE